MCISSDTDIHNVISSVSCSVVSNSLRLHDWRPPGSSVHGILQARILEWVAIPFSRISSWPRGQTQICCIAGRFFTVSATREACKYQSPRQIQRRRIIIIYFVRSVSFGCVMEEFVYVYRFWSGKASLTLSDLQLRFEATANSRSLAALSQKQSWKILLRPLLKLFQTPWTPRKHLSRVKNCSVLAKIILGPQDT